MKPGALTHSAEGVVRPILPLVNQTTPAVVSNHCNVLIILFPAFNSD